MKGTEFLLRSLVADGVRHLFLVPGGLVDPFLPALETVRELRPIVAAHEGGAAFMADGYARARGSFGVALVIGGPGLGNAVTAMVSADTDSVPLLVISGEVANWMEGLGSFQDASAGTIDDVSLVRSVSRWSYSVPDVRLLHHAYERALKTLFDLPGGPVHLSVPEDVQEGEVTVEVRAEPTAFLRQELLDIEAAKSWLAGVGIAPARTVLLAGPGAHQGQAAESLRQAAERWALPVASTLQAKGALPEDHPLSLGIFGYAGTRHATVALLQSDAGLAADLVVSLGAGMNERDSMHWSSRLAPSCGFVEVSSSSVRMGALPDRSTPVLGHADAFLRWLLASSEAESALRPGIAERRAWLEQIRASGTRLYEPETTASDAVPLHPARVIAEVRRLLPASTVALCDSGAHRAFACHYWEAVAPGTYFSAAGMGPMGWAIPAAVGTSLAMPDRIHVVFTGDGCMRMHGLEIATAARYRLPILYVVLNNAALGNVWLRAHSKGEIPDELTRLPDHDWAGVATGLGLAAASVRRPEEIAPALERILGTPGPWLLDAKCDRAYPTPIDPWREAIASWSYHE
ncbi:MAG: thiamine pyrophosphate-binding protein [Armatimonadetes bacterium]|nr:thiamine pyrophosphate-binding protein [Armatimonadota bacterium]